MVPRHLAFGRRAFDCGRILGRGWMVGWSAQQGAARLNSRSGSLNRKSRLGYLLPLMGLIAMLASGCGKSGRDTLILVDGSTRTGSLERCTAELCVFDGQNVPEATIVYIGLRADMPPPPPRDPGRDEVHRTDKSIHPGPLVSIDAANVVAASTHPREQVAWIYLTRAGPPGDRASGGDDCDRREVFLYDVLVAGEKSGSETKQGWEGEFAFSYVYSARYSRVPVTLEHQCGTGDIKISVPTAGDPHPGSGTLVSYAWRDSLTDKEYLPTDKNIFNLRDDGTRPPTTDTHRACGFDVAVDGLRAQIHLEGYIAGPGSPPGGRSAFRVNSRVRDGENRHRSLIFARHKEECNKGKRSNRSVFDGLAGHDSDAELYWKPIQVAGVSLEPPALNLFGMLSLADNYSVEVPAAVRALLRGDSFRVASGRKTWQKTYEGTNKEERATAAISVTVTFNRAR